MNDFSLETRHLLSGQPPTLASSVTSVTQNDFGSSHIPPRVQHCQYTQRGTDTPLPLPKSGTWVWGALQRPLQWEHEWNHHWRKGRRDGVKESSAAAPVCHKTWNCNPHADTYLTGPLTRGLIGVQAPAAWYHPLMRAHLLLVQQSLRWPSATTTCRERGQAWWCRPAGCRATAPELNRILMLETHFQLKYN